MRKYLIVRVDDADESIPRNAVVVNGELVRPITNLSRIRQAVHEAAETHFIGVADGPTHSSLGGFTDEESQQIENLFEGALNRERKRAGI